MNMLATIFRRIVNLLPEVEIDAKVDVEVTLGAAEPAPVPDPQPEPVPPEPVPPPPPAFLLEEALDAKAAVHKDATGEDLTQWRLSIVDLFKLVGEDASVASRRKLACALGITDYQPTEAGNVALSKRFLEWLRARG